MQSFPCLSVQITRIEVFQWSRYRRLMGLAPFTGLRELEVMQQGHHSEILRCSQFGSLSGIKVIECLESCVNLEK